MPGFSRLSALDAGEDARGPDAGEDARAPNTLQIMLKISGVYEVAVRVKELARAEAFYRNILGLDVGVRDDNRNWLFLRAGGDAGMIVLQEDQGEWPTQHFAFTVDESYIKTAAAELRDQGIAVKGPVYHEWVPAWSLYFSDPDGHELELLAPAAKD